MWISLSPDQIQAYSTVVLAVFTIVLALATLLYTYQSRLQTREISDQTSEMAKTRELRYEPKLVAGIKTNGPNFELGFVNIGGGIAQNVEAEYFVKELEEFKREWGTAVHMPEDIYKIGIPLDDSSIGTIGMSSEIKSHLDDDSKAYFTINWSYENSRGDVYEETQEFDLLEKIETKAESTEFYTGNERDTRF